MHVDTAFTPPVSQLNLVPSETNLDCGSSPIGFCRSTIFLYGQTFSHNLGVTAVVVVVGVVCK